MIVKPVVVDTSVIISAILSPGKNADKALSLILERGQLVLCSELYGEIGTKLHSAKFRNFLSGETVDALLDKWFHAAIWVEISGALAVCNDPEDDMLFEAANVSNASAILTLDKRVLALHPWQGIQVLKPADFLSSKLAYE